MLEAIRKRSGSILVKLLLGLLILSFAVWGIGDMVSGRITDAPVASVGGVDIRPRDVSIEVRRLAPLMGGNFDMQRAREMGLVDAVLGRLVERTLFDMGGDSLGILISDRLVVDQVHRTPGFKGAVGGFDRRLFQQALARLGYSKERYLEAVRGDLARGQLLHSIGAGAAAPKALIVSLYGYRQEKRTVATLFVADDTMRVPDQAGDEELRAYHRDNAAEFTAPEYRAVTAMILRAGDLAKEIAVSEESLRQAFEERQDEFSQPERRSLSQIVVTDEVVAGRAEEMLSEGTDFAAVAKEVTGQEALDLGSLSREELTRRVPELAESAFSLAQGAVSRPIKTPFGWHLIRIDKIEAGHASSFADVRQALERSIAGERAVDSLYELSKRLEDALGGGATLEEAAAQANVAVRKVGSLDATGRDSAANVVQGLPPGGQFLSTAFETAEGEESVLTEAGTDTYFVLRVDGVTAPAVRPLAKVRAKVLAGWQQKRRAEKAKAAAEALLERVSDDSGNAQAIAKKAQAEYALTSAFTRDASTSVGRLSAALVGQVFGLSRGKAVMGRTEGGYSVAVLQDILPARPGSDGDGVKMLRRQVDEAMRSDLLAQYAAALRTRYPVSTNLAALDREF